MAPFLKRMNERKEVGWGGGGQGVMERVHQNE